jgi:Sulfotransferase family
MSKRPILVTGAHCSGSTWVGRMLSAGDEAVYINEPFNIHHDPGICGAKFKYWFTYICPENARYHEPFLRDTVHLQYNLKAKLVSSSSISAICQGITDALSLGRNRWEKKRPLLKDPIAVFSAEWLAVTFGMDVVITIRHPAAFAESLKSKNWVHPFSHFLEQLELMRDVLFPFETEIQEFVGKERNIIDQAALLWKIIYSRVDTYRQSHPEWIFVRHEDLSRNPIQGYQKLYQLLDLKFTRDVQNTIEAYSTKRTPDKEIEFRVIWRNSKSLIDKWQRQLTDDDIARIKATVWDVSEKFYSEDEW